MNSKIENKEEKIFLANKISQKVKNGDIIGFGSGTTSCLAAEAIGKKVKYEKINIIAVPTSTEVEEICRMSEIKIRKLNEVKLDWSFDGADEIDNNGNMIKGMGAAMFKEKLNFLNSPKVYILVDKSKFVDELGKKHAIPVECYPISVNYVKEQLIKLGAKSWSLREKKGKVLYTESNNIIIDAWFDSEMINEKLENDIKLITGVIETGLFIGFKNIEIL